MPIGGKLTGLKVKRHITADDPTNDDKKRCYAKSNLNARANGNTHSEIHLVADGDYYGCDMLRRVANNGNKNETNKGFANMHTINNVIDTSDQIIGADSD